MAFYCCLYGVECCGKVFPRTAECEDEVQSSMRLLELLNVGWPGESAGCGIGEGR